MTEYVTGLVVGKFCPLHKGHEFVIRSALAKCERVVVISYTSTKFDNCDPAIRMQWLRGIDVDQSRLSIYVLDSAQCPLDSAPDEEHREFCANFLLTHAQTSVQAVFSSEVYGAGFAAHLADFFTTRLGRSHKVDNIVVDQRRRVYDVSGTLLRRGDHRMMQAFLSPHVLKTFIKKVLLIGGESTGKTTLAQQLAIATHSYAVMEYGRRLFDERGGHLEYEDFEKIAREQLAAEDRATEGMKPDQYLFCDTSPLTTSFYSQAWCKHVAPRLADMVAEANTRYHQIYLCAPDFPMVQDGTRQDETFRLEADQFYRDYFHTNNIPYTVLTGSLEDRLITGLQRLS